MSYADKYEIEKNIPIEGSGTRKWPFKEMDVLDCVTIKDVDQWFFAIRAAHAYSANKTSHKVKPKFKCRWNKRENVGRIWRVQ